MKLFSLLVFLTLFFFSCSPVKAVIQLQISNFEKVNDYYSLDVTLTGASTDSAYYFQSMFTKADPPNYLGYTWGQKGEWVKYDSSPDKEYIKENFPLLENGRTLKILIKPDVEDKGYKGPGEYLLKGKRYTQGGSASFAENSLTITLSESVPEPEEISTQLISSSPNPSPTATLSPTQTPTISPTRSPTASPTPTKSPTARSTPSSSPTPTNKIIISTSPSASPSATLSLDEQILGATTTSSPTDAPSTQAVKGKATGSTQNIIFILLGLVLGLPATALYFFSNRVKIS